MSKICFIPCWVCFLMVFFTWWQNRQAYNPQQPMLSNLSDHHIVAAEIQLVVGWEENLLQGRSSSGSKLTVQRSNKKWPLSIIPCWRSLTAALISMESGISSPNKSKACKTDVFQVRPPQYDSINLGSPLISNDYHGPKKMQLNNKHSDWDWYKDVKRKTQQLSKYT